jgi:quinol monooxygenase YgiN
MATMFVRHGVSDFETWKQAFDAFDAERQSMGVTGHGVYQVDGSPNEVTVYHQFDSMEAARSFAASPRLQEVMKAAGVQGTPDIWFATRV